MNREQLKPEISKIITTGSLKTREKMQHICNLIQENLPTYNWVGFYMAHETEPTLHLWSQAGEPTDHTVIPFGKGICGQVAVSNKNFVVDDVKAQDNYIACSIHVKSEIVVPLFKNGKNIGQIDIDSNTIKAFNEEDERFLEWVNEQVATIL
ncbi:GAF domain-containing protein [Nonlabens marinus]|uniref:GAF domain-containing proteins n=1 Tax=Nonlabens marinus S1-08 TaxID=1454201 RepID=W8VX60_9FLAO|nr:GAF domain-containing protein [Nonlabens marinus]BAO55362.1 GAF domain-containing proteins [Nonlabens marinus S1-08]